MEQKIAGNRFSQVMELEFCVISICHNGIINCILPPILVKSFAYNITAIHAAARHVFDIVGLKRFHHKSNTINAQKPSKYLISLGKSSPREPISASPPLGGVDSRKFIGAFAGPPRFWGFLEALPHV